MLQRIVFLCMCVMFLFPAIGLAQTSVGVAHTEGLIHGFLVLRTLEGQVLADGDVTQIARNDRVTSHITFHFRDGSVHEETVVFSQRNRLQLISDHLLQKGPAFKKPMEVSMNALTGDFSVHYTDDSGKAQIITERLKLPPDIANGLILTLLKNIQPSVPKTTVSMVAATPKPRLVKLEFSPDGEDSFAIGSSVYKATRFIVHVNIGGIVGAVAPLVGKQPPDERIWILEGPAPAFIKLEGPLCEDCPIWRIELTSPTWQTR